MVDYFPYISAVGIAVTVIWGTFEIVKNVKNRTINLENRLISAIDIRLGSVKTKIEDQEKAFAVHVTEKEKLLLQLKDDIHTLEKHLQELCNQVSKHEGILQSVSPTIMAVQNNISELKVKVELMEKGMK
jgi:predicted  nucleic acid-binding Zn-ribbon protein